MSQSLSNYFCQQCRQCTRASALNIEDKAWEFFTQIAFCSNGPPVQARQPRVHENMALAFSLAAAAASIPKHPQEKGQAP